MTSPGRLLIVAIHFPPDFSVGALRPRRMAIQLQRRGWQVEVLSVHPRYLDGLDPGVCRGLEPVRVHRSHAIAPRTWLRELRPSAAASPPAGAPASPAAGASAPPAPRPAAPGRLRRVASSLQVPDPWLGWMPVALAVGAFLPRPDVILATAPVFTNFLVGAALSWRFRAPLVLDYRDPWNASVRRPELPRWRRRLEDALERACLRRARAVVTTTPGIATEIREQTDRAVHVVPNACEPERFEDVVPRSFDRPTLVYAGGLYGDRTLDPVFAALARLRDAGRLSPEALQVVYLGRTPEVAAASAEAHRVADFVRIEGARPSEEALAATAGATCNLSVVGGGHARQVPAKIFEHVAAGRPMLVLVPPDSDTEALLSGVPTARCVPSGVPKAIEAALLAVSEGGADVPRAPIPEALSVEATTAAIEDVLESARGAGRERSD